MANLELLSKDSLRQKSDSVRNLAPKSNNLTVPMTHTYKTVEMDDKLTTFCRTSHSVTCN